MGRSPISSSTNRFEVERTQMAHLTYRLFRVLDPIDVATADSAESGELRTDGMLGAATHPLAIERLRTAPARLDHLSGHLKSGH